jgi:DNA repair protein RecN (Recombination protein N)
LFSISSQEGDTVLGALRITNFAVIEEAEVAFSAGLTVMTGETGAGKSILIDALSLLLGGRADAELIRAGCDEAAVEGLFAKTPLLAARLDAHGLPDLGEEVSVRRVIGRSGRAKAYVNGALATVGVLGQVMRGLIDIAGQHEHMSLFNPDLHGALVDRVGRLDEPLEAYREAHRALTSVEARIRELGGDEHQAAQRREFLRFQLEELDRLEPQPGEDVRLEEERRRLLGGEKLRRGVASAESCVSTEEGSALERVGKALNLIVEAARIDPSLGEIEGGLRRGQAELEEAGHALSRYLGGLDFDPQRLAEVDERLDALRRLMRKHAAPLEAVVAKRAQLAAELDRLENRQGALEALESDRTLAHDRAWERARTLSALRSKAAVVFERTVREGLAGLALGKALLEVRVEPSDSLGAEGCDAVEFLFSANPGEPPRPLSKVASGGEASRVMLALKGALADSDDCSCYVFDEADAGVGGAVAEVVGRMIKDVSRHRQVLCITHLPQVAAFADAHLRIEKETRRGRTQSRVESLEAGEMRTRELARMLSGVEVTREALGAAEALLRSARGARALFKAARRPRANLALGEGVA